MPDDSTPSTTQQPRVTGIGGAFLYSDDAPALAAWYAGHLGIGPLQHNPEENCHYCDFISPAPGHPDGVEHTVWSIFQSKEPLGPGRRAFMMNYRVPDLDAMLAHLRALGVAIEKTQDESYGRFAWIHDLDGNRIELYQELG